MSGTETIMEPRIEKVQLGVAQLRVSSWDETKDDECKRARSDIFKDGRLFDHLVKVFGMLDALFRPVSPISFQIVDSSSRKTRG